MTDTSRASGPSALRSGGAPNDRRPPVGGWPAAPGERRWMGEATIEFDARSFAAARDPNPMRRRYLDQVMATASPIALEAGRVG